MRRRPCASFARQVAVIGGSLPPAPRRLSPSSAHAESASGSHSVHPPRLEEGTRPASPGAFVGSTVDVARFRRRLRIAAIFLCYVWLLLLRRCEGADPWPQLGQNGNHTGLSPFAGPLSPPSSPSLIFPLPDGGIASAPSIAATGVVFVASTGGHVYAVNGTTGIVEWAFTAGGAIHAPPTLDTSGSLYFGADDHYVYKVSAAGGLVWKCWVADMVAGAVVVGSDGTVYAGDNGGDMNIITSLGTLAFYYRSGGPVLGAAVILPDSGSVVFGSLDDILYSVSPIGIRNFGSNNSFPIRTSVAWGGNGHFYFGDDGGYINAVNISASSFVWQWYVQLGGAVRSSPAVSSAGTVVVGCDSGAVYAFSLTGAQLWSYATGGAVSAGPVLGSDGTVYVGSANGKMYALSSSGSLIWSLAVGANITQAGALGADGSLWFPAGTSLLSVSDAVPASRSFTPSPFVTVSVTASLVSQSATIPATTSATPSVSGSPPPTRTLSVSPSVSSTTTSSVSSSFTTTVSGTPSASPSSSLSWSNSASPSGSTSGTASAAATVSSTSSASASATNTRSGTSTTTSSVSLSVSVSPTAASTQSATSSSSLTLTHSISVTATSSSTLSSSLSVSGSSSNTGTLSPSGTPTDSSTRTVTVTGSQSASVSLTRTPSPSVTATDTATDTATITSTSSTTPSLTTTFTVTVTASSSATPTVTVSPSPSATPSPCPPACTSCVSINCTACESSAVLGDATGGGVYACGPAPSLPPSLACALLENATVGALLSCPGLALAALPADMFAASLAAFTVDGYGHPFAITAGSNSSIAVAVGPLAFVYPLDYGVTPQYNITLSVCAPQAIAAFTARGAALSFASCAASGLTVALPLTITVWPVDKPPHFTLGALSISTPGVAVVNGSVGSFPLSAITLNPNTVLPWSVVTYTLTAGVCGAPTPQTSRPGLPPLPFTVSSSTGALTYTAIVQTVPVLTWFNPLSACATVTDGGGLSASINITVTFTDVAMQLSVFPTSITATHYAPGTSSSAATVSLYVGSHYGVTWGATSSDPVWLSGAATDGNTINITLSSVAFANDPVPVHTGRLTCATSDGSLSVVITVTLRMSIGRAAVYPIAINQIVRQGAVADSSFTIGSVGSGPLRYAISGGSAWGKALSVGGTVPPGNATVITLRAVSGSLPPSLYTTLLTITTNEPLVTHTLTPGGEVAVSAGASYAINWSMQVVLALLFPTQAVVTVTPNSPSAPSSFSVINFAGVPILVTVPVPTPYISIPSPQLYLQQAEIGSFTVETSYPLALSPACAPYCPVGAYTVSLGVLCWKLATAEEAAAGNGTAELGETLSPFSVPGAWYVPIPLPSVTITANASVGVPDATSSAAVLTLPSRLLPHSRITISVAVVDAAGFTVPFTAALSAVSVRWRGEDNATDPITIVSVTYNDTAACVDMVLEVLRVGGVSVQVLVADVPVPSGAASLTVTLPVCVDPTRFDTLTQYCVCKPGYYSSDASCLPCPAGTYKPTLANGTVSTCLPCAVGWYCLPGSADVSGLCPGLGFGCGDGSLRLLRGYWCDPLGLASPPNATLTALPCGNPGACVGATALTDTQECGEGYGGRLCGVCERGFVNIGSFCMACRLTGLEVAGIVLIPLVTVLCVATAISLILEESAGVKPIRQVWINSYSEVALAQFRLLSDFLQVTALQALIPARESQWFVAGLLSLTGAAVGGGFGIQTWQPFLCVISPHNPHASFWAQLAVVPLIFPIAALVATVSQHISRLLWKATVLCHSWRRRCVLSFLILQSCVSVAVIRAALAAYTSGYYPWFSFAVLVTYVVTIVGFVLFCVIELLVRKRMGWLVQVATAGYKASGCRFLFDVLLFGRKIGIILIALYISDPFIATLLSLFLSVAVWFVTVLWKPMTKQLQPRSLQAVTLTQQALMLLQAGGHGRASTMLGMHVLWLSVFCVTLAGCTYSLLDLFRVMSHPPSSLVKDLVKNGRPASLRTSLNASVWTRELRAYRFPSIRRLTSRADRVRQVGRAMATPPLPPTGSPPVPVPVVDVDPEQKKMQERQDDILHIWQPDFSVK